MGAIQTNWGLRVDFHTGIPVKEVFYHNHKGSINTDSPTITIAQHKSLRSASKQSRQALDQAAAAIGGDFADWWASDADGDFRQAFCDLYTDVGDL